jgi:hypothetical protein
MLHVINIAKIVMKEMIFVKNINIIYICTMVHVWMNVLMIIL